LQPTSRRLGTASTLFAPDAAAAPYPFFPPRAQLPAGGAGQGGGGGAPATKAVRRPGAWRGLPWLLAPQVRAAVRQGASPVHAAHGRAAARRPTVPAAQRRTTAAGLRHGGRLLIPDGLRGSLLRRWGCCLVGWKQQQQQQQRRRRRRDRSLVLAARGPRRAAAKPFQRIGAGLLVHRPATKIPGGAIRARTLGHTGTQ
jgi:hypothetical protein